MQPFGVTIISWGYFYKMLSVKTVQMFCHNKCLMNVLSDSNHEEVDLFIHSVQTFTNGIQFIELWWTDKIRKTSIKTS